MQGKHSSALSSQAHNRGQHAPELLMNCSDFKFKTTTIEGRFTLKPIKSSAHTHIYIYIYIHIRMCQASWKWKNKLDHHKRTSQSPTWGTRYRIKTRSASTLSFTRPTKPYSLRTHSDKHWQHAGECWECRSKSRHWKMIVPLCSR